VTWQVLSSRFMTDSLANAKASLRQQVRARLQAVTPSASLSASRKLCEQLRSQSVWSKARSVLFFAPLPDEPNLWPLLTEALAAGKTVCLPRFRSANDGYVACQVRDLHQDLIAGKFNIREPAAACPEVPLNRLDLVLVPGVAFDVRGGRLGRGKGFYDRLLATVNGTKCGVAFDEQLVDAVPVGPMDVRLDCILTPTRWIET
jgi:5-formyltetrahydrofolate cyclo-ligase